MRICKFPTAVRLICFLVFFGGFKTVGFAQLFSDSAAYVHIVLVDGVSLFGDSVKHYKERIRLFDTKLSNYKVRSRDISHLEIFKMVKGRWDSIYYSANDGEWNFFEMESMISGRRMAFNQVKVWHHVALGFSVGVITGYALGPSIPSIGMGFVTSYGYLQMPIFSARKRTFINDFEKRGFKQEIKDSRYIPFLFANLVGIVVGVSQL
ncbi:hypothetical protein [Luteibaculum oceani]|uniref:Uncharacterized protein n=1 Tax=Luteibaculum oceani TaxID=1294296 RepID=A0A5C6VDL2_9FLAO|nr:hypothetical protein [Luteibaculum oceani]TXC81795.1 hypothetical protein FRX97_04560 [Luteibaculum oceani]